MVSLPNNVDNKVPLPRPRKYGDKFGKQMDKIREQHRSGVFSPAELNSMANKATEQMKNYYADRTMSQVEAMSLLRMQYNLEFKMWCNCDKCNGSHDQDEIYAPER